MCKWISVLEMSYMLGPTDPPDYHAGFLSQPSSASSASSEHSSATAHVKTFPESEAAASIEAYMASQQMVREMGIFTRPLEGCKQFSIELPELATIFSPLSICHPALYVCSRRFSLWSRFCNFTQLKLAAATLLNPIDFGVNVDITSSDQENSDLRSVQLEIASFLDEIHALQNVEIDEASISTSSTSSTSLSSSSSSTSTSSTISLLYRFYIHAEIEMMWMLGVLLSRGRCALRQVKINQYLREKSRLVCFQLSFAGVCVIVSICFDCCHFVCIFTL
jgi:hypothetical protein